MSAVIGVPNFGQMSSILAADSTPVGLMWLLTLVVGPLFGLLFVAWLVLRYIPNDAVGIVEKLWSLSGSVPEGRIMASGGEAGFHSDLLRGGLHFGLWRWQYVIHKMRLVTIPQGKIGYVYARDGDPLPPSQALARVVASNHFQDSRAFLGERGRDTRGRRPARSATCRADRRHLLHQPLVRDRPHDSENNRADRTRRRRCQLLRPAGPRPVGHGVPPRRTSRRGRTRRLGESARPRKVRLQHVCRQHHFGPDDELRAALDHRQVRVASVRRRSDVDRPRDEGRLRADAQRVFPRRGTSPHDAGTVATARCDSGRGTRGAAFAIRPIRHAVRGRVDRQARHLGQRWFNRHAAGAVADAAVVGRAT